MADSETKSEHKHKKNKRKLKTSPEDNKRHSKTHRIITPEEDEFKNEDDEIQQGGVWSNLDLILPLQNKQIHLQRKIQLAFSYINTTKLHKEDNTDFDFDLDQSSQTVSFPRLITFLLDWIQSILISSTVESYLDFKCWEIFKFCVEECLRLNAPLSFSPNLLRTLSCVAREVLSKGLDFECSSVVCDCAILVFSQRGRVFNANVDLWVMLSTAVVDVVQKVYSGDVGGGNVGEVLLRFSCVVLEPFADFLGVHPSPKNIFPVFVERLLEPFLNLLVGLDLQSEESKSIWTEKLMKTVGEILSNGLFHPVHIDGFLTVPSMENTSESNSKKNKKSKVSVKSYHRHFFQKLEYIISEKAQALSGIGWLFHLFIVRVKKQKSVHILPEKQNTANDSMAHSDVVSENTYSASRLDAETRKSLFGLFVHFVQPLTLNLKNFSETTLEGEKKLFDTLSSLKSINKVLATFMQEKVYARTDDDCEGACLNFFKDIFETVISFAAKIYSIWSLSSNKDHYRLIDMLPSLAIEIIDSLGYFLEIEYEVIENDLVSLWLIMFLYSEIELFLVGTPKKHLLTSRMPCLGSQLVKIYSDLRQVHKPIFALCKAARIFGFHDKYNEVNYSRLVQCISSTSAEIRVQSITILICSEDIRLAIFNAIKSIPEGQVSGCVCQLKMDISESLQWMKMSCSMDQFEGNVNSCLKQCCLSSLRAQVEIFGRVLCEIYTLILDYLAVTTGNSVLVGSSINDLMTVVKPNLSSLVGKRPDGANEFLFSVTGIKHFTHNMSECKNKVPLLESCSAWVFLFFFRVYVSCRSLIRQSISLMPPNLSKKTSIALGDMLTAYCGNDWMHGTDCTGGEYFSWITEPSDSLLHIIQSVSVSCLRDSTQDCAQLIYIMHVMSLQRLVDLNRQIKALEFLLEKVVRLAGMKSLTDANPRPCRKERKFYKKRISVLRQEATDIVGFFMRYLPVVKKSLQSVSSDYYINDEVNKAQSTHVPWDLSVCSLTEKLLPTSVWWILCQNTDIWCTHATDKKLGIFLSCFLQSSSSGMGKFIDDKNEKVNGLNNHRIVTMYQISLALLSDTIFHEESFLCRHLPSSFCHALKKTVLPLFNDSLTRDVNFKSIPKWHEVLREIEEMPVDRGSNDNPGIVSDSIPAILFSAENRKKLVICQNLLTFLSSIPKGHVKAENFSVYATHILNIERLVVLSLLHYSGESCMQNQTELFRLFLYSRRALKCLVMAYCEDKIESGHSLTIPVLFESSFSTLWLLKSVFLVVPLLHSCSEEHVSRTRHTLFSLMDHTSYLFLTLSKIQYRVAVSSLLSSEMTQRDLPLSGESNAKVDLSDPATTEEISENRDVWMVVVFMAETLKEQTQNLLFYLKSEMSKTKTGRCFSAVDFNRMSSMISCFQGFLWGLSSVLNDIGLRYTEGDKSFRWKLPRKLFPCIDEFENFINFCINAIVEERCHSGEYSGSQGLQLPESREDMLNSETNVSGAGFEQLTLLERENCIRKAELASDISVGKIPMFSETTTVKSSKSQKKVSQMADADTAVNSLNNFDSFGRHQLKTSLLKSLLSGENPELAFLIRELLTASSAILKLKMKIGHQTKKELKAIHFKSPSSSMAVFIWTSQFLLSEFRTMVKEPHPFSFVWLDGVIRYTEVLGSYISLIDSTSSRNAYTMLINLHMGALGRCISFQGKGAALASHEAESCTEPLGAQKLSSTLTLGHGPYSLDQFKARVRMSFRVLIQKPFLLTAMDAIKRALVGVQEGCSMIYEMNTGLLDGGKVSPIAGAGVDCFDMVLESVSGGKRLDDIKSYTEGLVGAVFNIILHLRGPNLFNPRINGGKVETDPDPGSVTLMSVEVLAKVAGKPSLFQMHSSHIGQSFHVPAALFQDFLRLRSSQPPPDLFLDKSDLRPIEGACSNSVYEQFSVELFAACCRLLCTVLRHHKSESERCIGILQSSVCVLLHCLEAVEAGLNGTEGDFAWKLHDGVKCASFLRRIYEEIRQQKEVLRSYCPHFLSNYISIYSGNGPRTTGIHRDIDDALRPGVYALMDACSPEDLQQLHTLFGEGPCRSTLASLQHDYKQNFQYEGKV